ncbi:MAG: hypothetical protein ILO34_04995 [Kiritimatiellae bacterium]|nr:hypothetical protein [Kiritimatiellia bacterium]
MISLWRIFWLESVSLLRSKTVAVLLAASAAWMFAFPHFAAGDGTAEGAREMYLHYSLGGVFAILLVSLLASATGAIASERAAKRLQLTVVRPVSLFAVAWGKAAAHVAVGALTLAFAAVVALAHLGAGGKCSHVLKPVMESEREEAARMYDAYMADPETPEAVKQAKKSVVLRLLAQRAGDHYQTIAAGSSAHWRFDGADGVSNASVRLRFSTMFDSRQDVAGEFTFGGAKGIVSNQTQAVIEVPLKGAAGGGVLEFSNLGANALMLRPRKDIGVMVPADGFPANLLRSYLTMVSILALAVSFGIFLGAALSRPVAIFTAMTVLALGEMSPGVVDQYPDQLETDRRDRIGLAITRFTERMTRPVSSASPLERLSRDECVEWGSLLKVAVCDLVLLPAILAALSALAVSRRDY